MTSAHRLRGIARWGLCLALVLGAHTAAAVALLAHWHAPAEAVASAPAILIDLAPAPAAPAAVSTQLPPGPPQRQSAEQPVPEKKVEKSDIVSPPEAPIDKPPEKIPPDKAVEKAVQTNAITAPKDVVMLAMLPPPRPHIAVRRHEQRHAKSKPRPQRASIASAPSHAERRARHTAALSPGVSRPDSDALPNWKSRLLARLERYKRYPPEAQQRGEEGVAQLAFSIDRSGVVHNAHIVHSSGSPLLDRATLALLQRAQPLPPPPAELGGARVSIVVPIRYNIR